jgi:hypothetical protein
MKQTIYFIFSLGLFLALNSCLNKYEKEVVGNYELYKYELNDKKFEVDNFTKLNVKKDKTFEMKSKNITLNGKWEADDSGDWTYIELELNDQKIEGRISGSSIIFGAQFFKEFDDFKSMEFTRIK